MSVIYAKADSTVFSTLSFPQTTHPTSSVYQTITNHLSPKYQIIFLMAQSILAIIVQPESMSRLLNQTFGLGGCDYPV